jgi:hypothetical protein
VFTPPKTVTVSNFSVLLARIDPMHDDLAEARARLEAVREALWPLLDASGADRAAVGRIAARLDRMAAEVARIEGVVEGLAAAAGGRSA